MVQSTIAVEQLTKFFHTFFLRRKKFCKESRLAMSHVLDRRSVFSRSPQLCVGRVVVIESSFGLLNGEVCVVEVALLF